LPFRFLTLARSCDMTWRTAAVILRRPGMIDTQELCRWINERVDAENQRVRSVVIMEDVPHSTVGKTLKPVLREPYCLGKEKKI